ncbi:antibiotic biosynthesis monooxygenase [Jiangella mangrovi]|uniref:Quinol monooxygenase YgiN n=1 Tax=Jiangella mangrovi TaxID=1524084 RepID=A0A7W9GU90_9ACTN|nr:quinol monooxygenase YgiN [Jiangella mangrovi]
MIIVAGYLRVDAADREAYLATCVPVVEQARATEGCLDFALSADLVDPERINVLERWATRAALDAFRGDGTGDEQTALITGADVREFTTESETRL